MGDPVLTAAAIAPTRDSGGLGRREHTRPARARRGDRGAPGARARATTTARAIALSRVLLRTGEIDRARALLEDLEAEASARGDDASRAQVMWWLSILEWLAGHLAAARSTTPSSRRSSRSRPSTRMLASGLDVPRHSSRPTSASSTSARASAEEAIAFSQANSSGALHHRQPRCARPNGARARQSGGAPATTCATSPRSCSQGA